MKTNKEKESEINASQEGCETKSAECDKELERKVNERTKALADRVEELESLNRTMVGREMKMIELKKEIEDLKK